MNDYRVEPFKGASFTVCAPDSDYAVWAANDRARELGLPSVRSRLILLDSAGDIPLGEFDLQGPVLPVTWAETLDLVKSLRADAKAEAAKDFDYGYWPSRGAVLVAENQDGETVISCGDLWPMPGTKSAFEADIALMKREHKDIARIGAVASVDGATSPKAYRDGDYQPIAGEALAWLRINL